MVKMNEGRMHEAYPFARRYAYEPYLVHRTIHGTEILIREDEVATIKM